VDELTSEFYHTTVFHTKYLLKKLWDSIWELSADEVGTYMCITAMPIDSLYEFFFIQASQLWNKVQLCGQHLATDPSSVSPVSVAVIFLPPNMEPNHRCSVSPNPCHLAMCVMSCEVLSIASSLVLKSQLQLPVFHCFLYMCKRLALCSLCALPSFVDRLL